MNSNDDVAEMLLLSSSVLEDAGAVPSSDGDVEFRILSTREVVFSSTKTESRRNKTE